MIYKEATKEAKIQINAYENMISYCKYFEPKEDTSKYEYRIEFLKTAIEALEKQIPKMPVTRTIYNKYLQQKETTRVCPVCGIDTPVPRELSSWESWCPDCGQRIDWSKPKGNDCEFIFIDEVVAYDTQKKD